jgi:predicted nucleic acid-binding protein
VVLDEPGDREARASVEGLEPLIALELIVAEVRKAIWRRLTPTRRTLGKARVLVQPYRGVETIHGLPPLAARALEIAAALRDPAYDCFYLALAEEQSDRLLTADRHLASRLSGTPTHPPIHSGSPLWRGGSRASPGNGHGRGASA